MKSVQTSVNKQMHRPIGKGDEIISAFSENSSVSYTGNWACIHPV